jgi:hypothetical protein
MELIASRTCMGHLLSGGYDRVPVLPRDQTTRCIHP